MTPQRAVSGWRLGAAARAFALALALGASFTARASEAPPLQLIAPAELATATPREIVNVLGRTTPGARVRVGGQDVPVYATGIFVRDRVPLALGTNRIRVEAEVPGGGQATLELTVERTPPPAPPAPVPTDRIVMDLGSIQPQAVLRLAPGETVDVRLRGTPGQKAEARLPGQPWQLLVEDKARPGLYRADLAMANGPDTEPQPVELRLSAPRKSALHGQRPARARSSGTVGRWAPETLRLFTAGPEGADLLHGLHEVRLGGPNLAELPPGTVLRVVGQHGGHYRVRLAADTHAWVLARSVVPAEPGTRLPAPVFTGVHVAGSPVGDVVTLPFPAPAPYAVRSVATPDGRVVLEADLFGTHLAATWITQLASARGVREVTLEQPADGRVRLRIVPNDRRIWGWRVEQTTSELRITLRAAPAIAADTPSPLAGLLVALEPGHGGPSNLGAVGPTQTPEKDINRWTTEALKAELESVGARVVVVREGDDNPTLRERARRVTTSDAALFVSVHANAADTSQGYLRAAGTSMFHKHPASRELSTAIHRRMLEATALPDFGNVGNFNYAPTRLVTWMPAVLVEQAFVSNPAEEAKLLDPAFRAGIARAVRLGLEDYLRAR
jgi:N-acetylmuramoyl-L-alanine amidase